jgi:mono/diheme cytochrome c family protein
MQMRTRSRARAAIFAPETALALRLWLALLLGLGLLLAAATAASAEEGPDPQVLSEGKDDFAWHCASCHGKSGKGNGEMAKILVKPPSDLTGIAKANGGVFPFWRVYRIISGKTAVPGHETFQMPDFWKRFQGQEWEFGLLPPHVRVLELTHYVESLQEK